MVSVGAFHALLIEVTLRALNGGATLGDVAVFFGASARLRKHDVAGLLVCAIAASSPQEGDDDNTNFLWTLLIESGQGSKRPVATRT